MFGFREIFSTPITVEVVEEFVFAGTEYDNEEFEYVVSEKFFRKGETLQAVALIDSNSFVSGLAYVVVLDDAESITVDSGLVQIV